MIAPRSNLKGVDVGLAAVIEAAMKEFNSGSSHFIVRVVEGVRPQERQDQLFEAGITSVRKSKHTIGRAVDVGFFKLQPDARPGGYITRCSLYGVFYDHYIRPAAQDRSVNVKWGGEWASRDCAHFEL